MKASELYDREVPFEARFARLRAWIEQRDDRPRPRDTWLLLAHLVASDAIRLPLHLLFPGVPALDRSLLHPTRLPADPPHVDQAHLAAFIERHADLPRDTITALQDADLTYLALTGITPWRSAFPTRAAFEAARQRFEVYQQVGPDGAPIHEDDVFWYVAAREFGIDRPQAEAYKHLELVYLFAEGIAEDDVGCDALPRR